MPGNVKSLLCKNMLQRSHCIFHFESIAGDFNIPIGFMKAISGWVAELFLKKMDSFS
jgi:hypothetical protein